MKRIIFLHYFCFNYVIKVKPTIVMVNDALLNFTITIMEQTSHCVIACQNKHGNIKTKLLYNRLFIFLFILIPI